MSSRPLWIPFPCELFLAGNRWALFPLSFSPNLRRNDIGGSKSEKNWCQQFLSPLFPQPNSGKREVISLRSPFFHLNKQSVKWATLLRLLFEISSCQSLDLMKSHEAAFILRKSFKSRMPKKLYTSSSSVVSPNQFKWFRILRFRFKDMGISLLTSTAIYNLPRDNLHYTPSLLICRLIN